ncbi:MAG: nicotinamide riboside transporter PnuC [Saprospiraceae bacterium]|nr:nicotinamide riboside transporter PnuC [Saprospiraceae bacterium]MDW8483970.1 nicotinamide riboside transporter PnuC [Saprospiraceae bacterium]
MWLNIQHVFHQLIEGLRQTSALEFIAVIFGIASVLFSRKEHIWVYPTGLVNTVLYIYLSIVSGLYAEASVNTYYTVMGIVGWIHWSRKRSDGRPRLVITTSDTRDWAIALLFFAAWWICLYYILDTWTDSTVPAADGFAAATAYTGMWLMTRKKLENWLWWMVTNLAAIPLYFVKGLVFTSFQYFIFFVLAIAGYVEWRRRIEQ